MNLILLNFSSKESSCMDRFQLIKEVISFLDSIQRSKNKSANFIILSLDSYGLIINGKHLPFTSKKLINLYLPQLFFPIQGKMFHHYFYQTSDNYTLNFARHAINLGDMKAHVSSRIALLTLDKMGESNQNNKKSN